MSNGCYIKKDINKMVKKKPLTKDKETIKELFVKHLDYTLGKPYPSSNKNDCYKAICLTINDFVMERWNNTQKSYYEKKSKRIYYLSLEYLIGRLISSNLINLNLYETVQEALSEMGLDIGELEDIEEDAALGNGGLGRLAACYLDSMATLELPVTSYGIYYDYGLFKQTIRNGAQYESPDHWLRDGYPWVLIRPEYNYMVNFYGHVNAIKDAEGKERFKWVDSQKIRALAHDMAIIGYNNETVNTLRLWSAEATDEFDLHDFNKGDYIDAVVDKIRAENISRVLYPSDNYEQGRKLRLKQEYFLVSSSMQDVVRRYKNTYPDFSKFSDNTVIQLNDTHPALSIPELMRIFMDEEGMEWDEAWGICQKCFAYTNHTILPEALEKWSIKLMEVLLPRILQIIIEINYRFIKELKEKKDITLDQIQELSIIEESAYKQVKMANMLIVGSFSVNGVAELHSNILKEKVFKTFNLLYPKKFNNKTNGISQRRWLRVANPDLAALIGEKIGNGWMSNLQDLNKLADYLDNNDFKNEWKKIKRKNKQKLADFILENNQIKVNPDSLFDCHVKRIHEYKRQLLNLFHTITLYNRIKDSKGTNILPRTIIFSGKAAPGYFFAKQIIKLITSVANKINNDPDVNDYLKVVFLENYRVTLAEMIIPAADLSEQISTAGMEASGTGNMKFALNGALTIGTLDGANIEIKEQVGDENIFIFGHTTEEIYKLRNSPDDPMIYLNRNIELARVIDQIKNGFFAPENPTLFMPIIDSLLKHGDFYKILPDFDSYIECQDRVAKTYQNQDEWVKMSIMNSAFSSFFSSDRSIDQYNKEIWHAEKISPTPRK